LLSAKKRAAFDASFKGTEAKVLWESVNDEGKISGFTENYIKVIVPFDETLSNCITSITI
jgi:threonylcarbamoyladenosine tRNA methylthiotransferase MtaB